MNLNTNIFNFNGGNNTVYPGVISQLQHNNKKERSVFVHSSESESDDYPEEGLSKYELGSTSKDPTNGSDIKPDNVLSSSWSNRGPITRSKTNSQVKKIVKPTSTPVKKKITPRITLKRPLSSSSLETSEKEVDFSNVSTDNQSKDKKKQKIVGAMLESPITEITQIKESIPSIPFKKRKEIIQNFPMNQNFSINQMPLPLPIILTKALDETSTIVENIAGNINLQNIQTTIPKERQTIAPAPKEVMIIHEYSVYQRVKMAYQNQQNKLMNRSKS